jgi:hypothetical protein
VTRPPPPEPDRRVFSIYPTGFQLGVRRIGFRAWVLGGILLAGISWGAESASVLRLELFAQTGQVALFHRGRSLALYEFRPASRKPCLSLFCSIEGINVLEDTTTDAPFVRGLGLGFEVNGNSFSQQGGGLQKSGPEITRGVHRDAHGCPVAEVSHTVFWVPTQATPARREAAWLIEERRLRFVIDESGRETAVEWHSDFEVGQATEDVTVTASEEGGLTLRLIPDFRPWDLPEPADPESEAAEGDRAEASPALWSTMSAHIAGRRLTVALFDDTRPSSQPVIRAQTDPFTMISAAQGLDSGPWVGRPGDRFRVRALITVLSGEPTATRLEARRERWLNP